MTAFVLRRSQPEKAAEIFERAREEARRQYREHDVLIEIGKFSKSRTGQQNRYFWALVGLIADETGQPKEDIKDRLMHALGHKQMKWVNGEAITVIKSTTQLNVEQFGELIEATQQLCRALNINYPEPGHYGLNL